MLILHVSDTRGTVYIEIEQDNTILYKKHLPVQRNYRYIREYNLRMKSLLRAVFSGKEFDEIHIVRTFPRNIKRDCVYRNILTTVQDQRTLSAISVDWQIP